MKIDELTIGEAKELAAHGIEVQHVPNAPPLGPEVLVWKTGAGKS
jgi:aspartokinase